MESSESLSIHRYPSSRHAIADSTSEDRSRPHTTERSNSMPFSSGRANSLALYSLPAQNPFADAEDDRSNPFGSKPISRCSSQDQHEDISTISGAFRPTTARRRPDTREDSAQAVVSVADTSRPLGPNSSYFRSRRIKREDIQRPWLDRKNPREKWLTINPLIGLFIGTCIAAFLIWDGIHTVVNHQYCLILDDDFSKGLDLSTWTLEVELGGFGNGQFEMTTQNKENVFVVNEGLVIRPTLQNQNLIYTNNIINLTRMGTCSSQQWSDCVATTNVTNGTIVPPVKSGRVSTRFGPRIRYGRVEVTATLPEGDWLWPAIWMLPANDTYGIWPNSGEIDIAESRGTNFTYPLGGNNIIGSTLHWGPTPDTDAWWRTTSKRAAVHTTYSTKPHTFGMEWSESYIFTYVDSRLLQVLYFGFSGDLWSRGNFPLEDPNGTRLIDPWSQTGHASTPFDRDFYLVLNLAVGATNGWFEDGVGGKPWVDGSSTAKRDFWDAQDQWFPTWTNHGDFKIHRVRMWQQEGYNGCLTAHERKEQA